MAQLILFNKFKESLIDLTSAGTPIAFGTDALKIALVTSGYVPAANDQFYSSPQGFEVTGSNYDVGGKPTVATIRGGGTTSTVVALSNVTWTQHPTGFLNARFAIIYKVDGAAPLIGFINFGVDKGNTTGDLMISFDQVNGAFSLT